MGYVINPVGKYNLTLIRVITISLQNLFLIMDRYLVIKSGMVIVVDNYKYNALMESTKKNNFF